MQRSCEFQWFGQPWKCIRGPVEDTDRGLCDTTSRTITIDESLDLVDFINALHHELWEGASYLAGCTFTRPYPDNQDLFVMTHSQMDLISGTICGAYEEITSKMIGPRRKPR